jgi:uncharacterized protein
MSLTQMVIPEQQDVASPCIDICRMDEALGLCAGCYRTRAEIATWKKLSNEEKRALLTVIAERQNKLSDGSLHE